MAEKCRSEPDIGLGDLKSKKVLTGLDGATSSEEMIKKWQSLSLEDQQAFQKYLENKSLMDISTVEVSSPNELNFKWKPGPCRPFVALPSEKFNTVVEANKDKTKRDEQIEAAIQGIQHIFNWRLPRGMVLNNDVVQSPVTSYQTVKDCDKMKEVLGKGNSAGEIQVIMDRKSQKNVALKTVMVSQFNANEIRLWVKLGDLNQAPELYHFELIDNKLVFTMEIMTGKDLQDVIDQNMWEFNDQGLARDFSLCILQDLLHIWEEMRRSHYVQADMHGGNLRLETSMKLKIFDFGRAKNLLESNQEAPRLIENDIVGIIRIFCAVYSGYDFNDVFEARKVLKAGNLKELDECMIRISEENRREMYKIMLMLFDTIKGDPKDSSFGSTDKVSSHVRALLPDDYAMEVKRKAAVIIFPDKYRDKPECDMHDGWHRSGGDRDPIWHDPDMELYMMNVSDISLKELGDGC